MRDLIASVEAGADLTSGSTTTSGVVAPADRTWAQRLEESRAASVRLRKRAILAQLDAAVVMLAVEDARPAPGHRSAPGCRGSVTLVAPRLPLPGYVSWPTFPYEGELRVRPVADVVLPEPPRSGAGGVDCFACTRSDDSYVWTNARWRATGTEEPSGMPVVLLLEPRVHADLHDLPEELVAELGTMLWRIESALTSLGGVGRVQTARWGDGAEHLHWWFLVRPLGLVQARGSFLADWDDVLPPRPREEWAGDLRRVAAALDGSEPSHAG